MSEQLRAILLTILIFMYSGAFVQNDLLPVSVNVFTAISLAITGLLILSHFKASLEIAWHAKSLMLFLILVIVSTLWSIIPDITFRRTIALAGASALGVYIASHYDLKQQVAFYSRVLIIAVISSFLVVILFPQNGIHQDLFHIGRWRGITLHKNILGEWVSLSAVILLFLPENLVKIPRDFKYIFAFLSIILLIFTGSLTSMVSFGLIVVLFPVIVMLRADFRLKTAIILYFLAAVLLATVIATINFSDLLNQIGRTPTLSGRSVIWPVVVSLIAERPVLGYGYMSFFVPDSYWLETRFTEIWRPEHAHNVWLDTGMDFGLTGILMLAYIMIRSLQQSYELYVGYAKTEVLLVVLLVLNILTRSMTETLAIRRRDIIWIMFISLLVRLHYEYNKRNQLMPSDDDTGYTTAPESPHR